MGNLTQVFLFEPKRMASTRMLLEELLAKEIKPRQEVVERCGIDSGRH